MSTVEDNLAALGLSVPDVAAPAGSYVPALRHGNLVYRDAARNFNLDTQHPHAFRYSRAAEHVEVVRKLWDSFEDDVFIRDKDAGVFYDTSRVHYTDHAGEHFKVRGPLNVSRSPQGHPVIVQAGQSEDGRGLAAATAEVIFTAHQRLDTAQEFYRDIKARAPGFGRDPAHILIMPGVSPFVGRTEAEAREKYDRLTGLILEEDGIALIKGLTGGTLDLTGHDLDGPLPELAPTEGNQSRQVLIRQIADENGFSIRQLYQWVASARGHFTVVGTPVQIADTLQEWFENEGADGFNILPPWLPTGLTDFVDLVIPELQRRGLFRTAFFLPVVTTTAIIGVVMQFILDPAGGPVTLALQAIGLPPVVAAQISAPTTGGR